MIKVGQRPMSSKLRIGKNIVKRTKLECLTEYLKKAIEKPTPTLSQEVGQKILIMRLMTWLESEKKYASGQEV